jgi:DNA-binding response OmpR family regulator
VAVKHRVLVVEDDTTVGEVLCRYLGRAGLQALRVGDGRAAAAGCLRWRPDLVVLNAQLPGADGVEVFRQLRQRRSGARFVVLTTPGEQTDRLVELPLGADDYLTRPVSPREVTARVRSMLRHEPGPGAGHPKEMLVDGGLAVSLPSRAARLRGVDLALTGREFDLLVHFLRHPARVFTCEELLRAVWGWSVLDSSTVTVHVRRLRAKVAGDRSRPPSIVTVWGAGYRYDQGAHA